MLGCCALSRQSSERLSLRREAAEVERPDSSEVGGDITELQNLFYADYEVFLHLDAINHQTFVL